MATVDIEFEWSRAFAYELTAGTKKPRVIRQAAKRTEEFEPLRINPSLYLAFGALDGSADSFLAFAKTWGLLETPAAADAGEDVELWKSRLAKMRSWIKSLDIENAGSQSHVRGHPSWGVRAKLTSLDVLLFAPAGPETKARLTLQPRTLFDAMMLQLAQAASSGRAIATCQECDKWFEIGGEAKRNVAKFCSDQCRFRFNYKQRAKR